MTQKRTQAQITRLNARHDIIITRLPLLNFPPCPRFRKIRKASSRRLWRAIILPSLKENRLTQLAAASFNHSEVFRRCFLQFLGARNARKTTNCKAHTQQSIQRKGDIGHLDLEIIRGGRTVVLVENKVDAPLKAQQLRFYEGEPRLKSARKIALVKNYFDFSEDAGEWHVLHWRDFYLALSTCLDGKRKIPAIDAFIVRNFNQYLEAANMNAPPVITKSDVNDLARMLHDIS